MSRTRKAVLGRAITVALLLLAASCAHRISSPTTIPEHPADTLTSGRESEPDPISHPSSIAGFTPPSDTLILAIPDSRWLITRPNRTVGWCGETTIQQALSYFGRDLSQVAINAAGRPTHPDLYEDDIDKALTNLSVPYRRWEEKDSSLIDHLNWVIEEIRNNHPVILGVKVLPDIYPTSYVDHFVVARGFTPQGLIINTQINMDSTVVAPYLKLITGNGDGGKYTLVNRPAIRFARSITGGKR